MPIPLEVLSITFLALTPQAVVLHFKKNNIPDLRNVREIVPPLVSGRFHILQSFQQGLQSSGDFGVSQVGSMFSFKAQPVPEPYLLNDEHNSDEFKFPSTG